MLFIGYQGYKTPYENIVQAMETPKVSSDMVVSRGSFTKRSTENRLR